MQQRSSSISSLSSSSIIIIGVMMLVILFCSDVVTAGDYPSNVERPDPATLKHGQKYSAALALPTPVHDIATLPRNFDWCDRGDGMSLCTASLNQHIPQYCGSCWLHSTISSVNDRIKIAKGGRGTDVMLARQVILNCGHYRGKFGNGCHGGDPYDVLEYMHRFGLPSETCQTYKAKEDQCSDETICHNCMPYGEDLDQTHCWPVKEFTKYYVREYGRIHGEAAIMSEVFARGPVVCGMATTHQFDYNYTGGVFVDTTNAKEVNHDVEIVGWGETKAGQKYWTVRNSWGTYWGENGFFKLLRGANNLRIEENCVFAIVDLSDEERERRGEFVGSMYGRVKKPRDAQRDDRDAIRYGPLPENVRSLADQIEDQEARAAAKQKKAEKKHAAAATNNQQNLNVANDVSLPTAVSPAASAAVASMSSYDRSVFGSGIIVMLLIGMTGAAAVVYRQCQRRDYSSMEV